MNASDFARGPGLDPKTIANYLDLLVDLLLVRRLEPWHSNTAKRLVKSPRIYVRDRGLVHALLGLGDEEAVLGHPVAGGSWEGFVIKSLIAAAPKGSLANFYRTAAGAEIDLLITLPEGDLWVYEIKRNLSLKVERGFQHACQDLGPQRPIVIFPGSETYPLSPDIMMSSLETAGQMLRARTGSEPACEAHRRGASACLLTPTMPENFDIARTPTDGLTPVSILAAK